MTTRLTLPATVDLCAVAALADTLRSSPGSMLLDGSAVKRIGVAGLQLALSAQAAVQKAGNTFAIEHPSDTLRGAIRTAGADRLLASDR